MSEVATAAFIVEKSRQVRKASELMESFYISSRRNATILSDAKICAMFHQQRKQKLKNRYGYKYTYAFQRLVIFYLLFKEKQLKVICIKYVHVVLFSKY